MKKIKVRELSYEAFNKFGAYAPLTDPFDLEATGPKDAEIVFFRDPLLQDLGGAPAAFSTCRVSPRPFRVTDAEFHNGTCETAIPLDGDVVVWFAPATADETFPIDKVEAFRVPQGYAVMCRPGVWHYAAFPTGDKPVNVLIVLPERTYVNDVVVAKLPKDRQFEIAYKK